MKCFDELKTEPKMGEKITSLMTKNAQKFSLSGVLWITY